MRRVVGKVGKEGEDNEGAAKISRGSGPAEHNSSTPPSEGTKPAT